MVGTNIFTQGDGRQTFVGGEGGFDDCEEAKDVGKAKILASKADS